MLDTAYKANPLIYYVYVYLGIDGNPYYVGKGKDKRIDRQSGRTFIIPPKDRRVKIYENLTEEDALNEERQLIGKIGKENLLNKTAGGQGPSGHTFNQSKEWCEMISKRFRGPGNPFYSKKHTEETKTKMKEAAARNRTEEYILKQSQAHSAKNVYHFISPNGEPITINGSLNQFCKSNALNTGAMSKVHRNIVSQHKNWRKGK